MAAIIVHGGAYAIEDKFVDRKVNGCKDAAKAGYEVLKKGGTCLDAVEAAVRVLEDNPSFNAGHGSVLNKDGDIEMDAMIMEGKDLKVGAVSGVSGIANPVSLARLVMEKTEHTMLTGKGAERFSEQQGVPRVKTEELINPEVEALRTKYDHYGGAVGAGFNDTSNDHDTVGAVARDINGNIACATSTGGITLKRPGRVGDSPLIGCGGLADNTLGGVSTTGHGESITRVTLSNRVLSLLSPVGVGGSSITMDEAIKQSLKFMLDRTNGRGGLIMIDSNGEIGKGFTTKRMAWASINRDGTLQTGINEPRIQ